MPHVLWTPVAQMELEDILFYIRVADNRPETARQIGQELREHVDRHASRRDAGHSHSAAPSGWRYLKHKRWLIFYQPHAEGIEVMRVIDASRDLPSQLG